VTIPPQRSATDGTPRAADPIVADLATAAADGVHLFKQQRFLDAAAMFEEVWARCKTVLGSDHPSTLTVAGNFGVALVASGSGARRRHGITVIRNNFKDRSRVFGDDAPKTFTALDALATAYRLDGNVDQAVRLAKLVTAARTQRLGATDPDTLTSRMGLICALTAAGDLSTGLALFKTAIAEAQEAHGETHPFTLALVECGVSTGLIHTSRIF
jgi:Tetratricopeptide repeat